MAKRLNFEWAHGERVTVEFCAGNKALRDQIEERVVLFCSFIVRRQIVLNKLL
jgi:hypothetical protein